ncbi:MULTISPECIES: HEAT repeat domain-containing protein [unclassified Spirosoma]|uniref:HEAT repeat domain-containing protein n=1 Tax=unclassified Spirosoma TaxID=2621999 RepID=UPI000961140B|nr:MULTISPECIES: HEAT repeat domain-containing protein [unclassified Spirosoma]MBN8823300.1 HEAT repeat domain-containing protein [Spirosoma sp.]OJW72557.1 MAG: anti-sigma factor [Spirosoma sp. 48-14]
MEKLPINCEQTQEQFSEWLSNQLPDGERAIMEAHLADCSACREDAESTRQLWQLMGKSTLPEPSAAARVRFQAMLDTYKDTMAVEKESVFETLLAKLRQLWTPQYAMRLVYSVALLAVGIAAGYWFQRSNAPTVAYQQQVDTLSRQVEQMRQMMMLSLLENPAASERLRAVSYTEEINEVDDKVIDALLTTLNNDSNVNVRLVTLEALAKLADNPKAREGLVQSIAQQDSPLVQSALADVMVKLQEKRSIKPLRQLLRDDNLNHMVKGKIEQSIRELS